MGLALFSRLLPRSPVSTSWAQNLLLSQVAWSLLLPHRLSRVSVGVTSIKDSWWLSAHPGALPTVCLPWILRCLRKLPQPATHLPISTAATASLSIADSAAAGTPSPCGTCSSGHEAPSPLVVLLAGDSPYVSPDLSKCHRRFYYFWFKTTYLWVCLILTYIW